MVFNKDVNLMWCNVCGNGFKLPNSFMSRKGFVMKYVNWEITLLTDGSTDRIPLHLGIVMARTKEEAVQKGRIIADINGMIGNIEAVERNKKEAQND